jgi:large subunit ribosomal protein L29
MKVDDLRELEEDQLGDRLRSARRELYELRFKHAVGQLENSSQISKVRHDIARIMTVLTERDLGIVTHIPHESTATATAVAVADPNAGFEPDAPVVETPVEAPKPKRGRKAKSEEPS